MDHRDYCLVCGKEILPGPDFCGKKCERIWKKRKIENEESESRTRDCGFSHTIGTVTFNKNFWK